MWLKFYAKLQEKKKRIWDNLFQRLGQFVPNSRISKKIRIIFANYECGGGCFGITNYELRRRL
jgi:hypothetical protein